MTDSAFRGPVSNMGSMEDSPTTIQTEDGPIYSYQGLVVPDLRGGAFQKDGVGPGRVPAYQTSVDLITVDQIPSTLSTTGVAIATAITSGTAITLITVAPGNTTAGTPSIATGVPLVPFGSASPVTAAIALDFGFTTGTTTAGNTSITVVDNSLFTIGQWVAIGGGGNSSKTATIFTQVQTISTANTTTITVSPAPLGSLTNAPIAGANLFSTLAPPSTQYGPASPVPNSVSVRIVDGLFRMWDPRQALARNITVSGITGSAGSFLVSGWDVHGQAMSESITYTTGTTTIAGKKAFKYIGSVVPQYTDTTGTYSIGVGDVYGFPVLAPRYESVYWAFAGTNQTSSTGFTAGDATNPATTTSGDVRGTLNLNTISQTSNGVRRLYFSQSQPMWNVVSATPLNTAPFFGVTQK